MRDPEQKFEDLQQRTKNDRLTEAALDDMGERHKDPPNGDWWSIYFDDYGLHGSHERGWVVVHAEDGAEVDADLRDIDIRSALRAMNNRGLL